MPVQVNLASRHGSRVQQQSVPRRERTSPVRQARHRIAVSSSYGDIWAQAVFAVRIKRAWHCDAHVAVRCKMLDNVYF